MLPAAEQLRERASERRTEKSNDYPSASNLSEDILEFLQLATAIESTALGHGLLAELDAATVVNFFNSFALGKGVPAAIRVHAEEPELPRQADEEEEEAEG